MSKVVTDGEVSNDEVTVLKRMPLLLGPFRLRVVEDVQVSSISHSPVGWGSKIDRLHLYMEKTPPHNECPGYKQSCGEAPALLELGRIQRNPSLLSLSDLL